VCEERHNLATQYLAADSAYTEAVAATKDVEEDLGPAEIEDIKRSRDVALRTLLQHIERHGC